jgi:hypothetical protein
MLVQLGNLLIFEIRADFHLNHGKTLKKMLKFVGNGLEKHELL